MELPVRIPLPARATLDEALYLVSLCGNAEITDGPVVFDLRATTYADLFAVAMVASSIALRRDRGDSTTLELPVRQDAAEFIKEVGLESFARGSETGLGTLEVRQLRALDAMYTGAVTSMLVRGVPGITEENSYSIELCLNELLQNVFEWAHSPLGCFVLARWYHRTRSVRLVVLDRGIGIPTPLRRSAGAAMKDWDDAAVIQAAVEMRHLTSRANQVGGLGLKNVREVVLDRGGTLTIHSLAAKVSWSGDDVTADSLNRFDGTAIQLEFRPDAPVESPSEYVSVF